MERRSEHSGKGLAISPERRSHAWAEKPRNEFRGVGHVDGGQVIQSCLRAGWIDELTITRLPVLLGQGLPLFGPLAKDVRLRHLHTRSFGKSGAVQSVYGCGPAAPRPDGLSLQ
ncbi:dihydrofolate reductase family protein [Deinococcus wulumuqiensis]